MKNFRLSDNTNFSAAAEDWPITPTQSRNFNCQEKRTATFLLGVFAQKFMSEGCMQGRRPSEVAQFNK
jgi:hypothetical protein